MRQFEELLTAPSEELLKTLYKTTTALPDRSGTPNAPLPRQVARALGLTYAQLVCALGFNGRIEQLSDVHAVLGFESYDALAHERNVAFTTDVYQQLGIKDVLAIYQHLPPFPRLLEVMQILLLRRVQTIEDRIEATVNSITIERYKKEMRAVYNDGVAQPDFAEARLARTHSGFRALLGEVSLIVESRLIPVGDIFFRDEVLPEEKRRLMIRGLIPRELVVARLADLRIEVRERAVLEDQLKLQDA
jgi:hypothetical protein